MRAKNLFCSKDRARPSLWLGLAVNNVKHTQEKQLINVGWLVWSSQ